MADYFILHYYLCFNNNLLCMISYWRVETKKRLFIYLLFILTGWSSIFPNHPLGLIFFVLFILFFKSSWAKWPVRHSIHPTPTINSDVLCLSFREILLLWMTLRPGRWWRHGLACRRPKRWLDAVLGMCEVAHRKLLNCDVQWRTPIWNPWWSEIR